MSDYLNNFTFGKGLEFFSDKRYAHIVPALIERILTIDNKKQSLLWSVGNLGSVSGDAFVKVAYEDAWVDPAGHIHPGRVRLLPLNPSFCFPEWAPHDQERLLRFKLKYRFWATSPEGTRQVYTYTEILTDDIIEEYVNDTLISQRPNPLGEIPVVHIGNKPVASSPWGLADIQYILPLNRAYNETATDILDIINYHTAPVTVITGAKASNMERGANKIWGVPQKDAKVYNLEGGAEGLPQALEMLQLIKISMHEMTGVPETALGQAQPISNTSGVALSIQFMPLMMAYGLKKTMYEEGWKSIMRLALMTLFMTEPDTIYFNPDTDGIVEDPEVQLPVLNPNDPVVYQLNLVWPPPLPVDLVIKLNEIMMKMQLGLESKRGALLDLGEEYPDEKRVELFEELMLEAKMDGAKRILQANIDAAIMQLGVIPEGAEPTPPPPAPNAEGKTPEPGGPPASIPTPALGGMGDITKLARTSGSNMINELTTLAYGTKIPQARNVNKNPNED
jgi:Phage portal protein, SPP1 Gp6-like